MTGNQLYVDGLQSALDKWGREAFIAAVAEVLGVEGEVPPTTRTKQAQEWKRRGIMLFDVGDQPQGPWIHLSERRAERMGKAWDAYKEGT